MISKELKRAREYEAAESAKISDADRPVYHFTPLAGWLNDPNGFSFHRGEYHLFYQYHPYSTYWGPMHWGHAVSKDLVSWEYRPAALAPDAEYDRDGCFSGTALSMPDGSHMLVYTGCADDGLDPLQKGRWRQTQCLAFIDEDGEISKYEGNPVIGDMDMPENTDAYEFRDPYLWQTSDGTYMMLVAAGRTGEISPEGSYITDQGTQLLLYKSYDGLHWNYVKPLFEDERRIGIMWECPNLFSLGEKHMLIASPMDMVLEEEEAIGSVRFPKGNNVCCIAGSFDEETGTFTPDREGGRFKYDPVDCGLDFYAPQIMTAPDGRRIMIGWMQDPKTANYIRADEKGAAGTEYAVETESRDGYAHGAEGSHIFGQMTVPRELKLKDGKLYQWPVRELRSYRKDKLEYSKLHIEDEERELPGVSGRVLEMDIDIAPEGDGSYKDFSLRFAKDDERCVKLSYKPDRSVISIDRSNSGQCGVITSMRSIMVSDCGGSLSLRVLLDKWSAEIFVNGGEQVITLTYYTPQDADGISFAVDGKIELNITSYHF